MLFKLCVSPLAWRRVPFEPALVPFCPTVSTSVLQMSVADRMLAFSAVSVCRSAWEAGRLGGRADLRKQPMPGLARGLAKIRWRKTGQQATNGLFGRSSCCHSNSQCVTGFSGAARTWLKSIAASLSSSTSPTTALQGSMGQGHVDGKGSNRKACRIERAQVRQVPGPSCPGCFMSKARSTAAHPAAQPHTLSPRMTYSPSTSCSTPLCWARGAAGTACVSAATWAKQARRTCPAALQTCPTCLG